MLTVLLAIGLRAAFFDVCVRNIPPSSDESIQALQAIGIFQNSHDVGLQAKQYPRAILGRFPLIYMAQPYCFPTDSYVMAPFLLFLPRNALGARLVSALIGCVTVVLMLMILRRWGRFEEIWPGALLILVPSAYLLMQQTAYAQPGATWFLLALLAVYLAQKHRDTIGFEVWIAAGAGFCAGLGCSGSLLMAPALIGTGAMVGLSKNRRKALASAPAFGLGALVGLAPYFAAKRCYPGAYEAVSSLVPWETALKKLWDPGLTYTLQVAMGILPCYWPDNETTFAVIPGFEKVMTVIWPALFVSATGLCAYRFVLRTIQDRWPSLKTSDVFVAISWLCLLMYIVNKRSHSHTYRYLVFVVLSFPFLISYLCLQLGRWGRAVLGGLAVCLAVVNTVSAVTILDEWSCKSFAAREASLFDLKPVIQYLDEKGIDRCYGSWHIAYRLNYITNERIICSQFFNERFFGWPIPYKEVVDASTNIAFILMPRFSIQPKDFEGDMARWGVKADKKECGDFTVYTGFSYKPPHSEVKIPASQIWVMVSDYPQWATCLVDGNYANRWRSHKAQEPGMWVQLNLPAPAMLTRVTLFYNFYLFDRALSLNVLAKTREGWKVVAEKVPVGMDPFEFVNGHPMMGNQPQTIRFDPMEADALKIAVAEPNPGRDWTIGEVEIYGAGSTDSYTVR